MAEAESVFEIAEGVQSVQIDDAEIVEDCEAEGGGAGEHAAESGGGEGGAKKKKKKKKKKKSAAAAAEADSAESGGVAEPAAGEAGEDGEGGEGDEEGEDAADEDGESAAAKKKKKKKKKKKSNAQKKKAADENFNTWAQGVLAATASQLDGIEDPAAIPDNMKGYSYSGPLRPAYITPQVRVPEHIVHTDYAYDEGGVPHSEVKAKTGGKSIDVRTEEQLAGFRHACRCGREIIDTAGKFLKVGVTGDEIDRIVHAKTVELGGYPSPLNYYKVSRLQVQQLTRFIQLLTAVSATFCTWILTISSLSPCVCPRTR
jgi:hypothetical protein